MALKVFLNQLGQDVIAFIEGHGGGWDPDNPSNPPSTENVSSAKVIISTDETLQYAYPDKVPNAKSGSSKQST